MDNNAMGRGRRFCHAVCALLAALISVPCAWAKVDLFELSLEELADIQIGSLTPADSHITPAAVTVITSQDIQQSNARSLNELLEIHVPGLQWIYHPFGFSHLGNRGIMSDRDDKYLLVVNGQVLNQYTSAGAISERDLVLLSDIRRIEVFRGPGSALYGLGAVSMVVSIQTFSAQTDEVRSVTRVGLGEDFVSQELSAGGDVTDTLRYYVYAGLADVQGADASDAPVRFSNDFTTKWGDPVTAGEDGPENISADHAQYRDLPPLKWHLQLEGEQSTFWARYSRGGQMNPVYTENVAEEPLGRPVEVDSAAPYPPVELGYQQLTLSGEWRQPVAADWSSRSRLSYVSTDYERFISIEPLTLGGPRVESHREDNWLLSSYLSQETQRYRLALGAEWNHRRLGLDSPGYPDQEATSYLFLDGMGPWSVDVFSLVGEYQQQLQPQLTLFASGRLDRHDYSDPLFSPRLSLVWQQDDDFYKLILSRSQRMNFEVELRQAYLYGNDHTDPEVLNALELRWERHQDSGWLGLSWFYYDLDVIGYQFVDAAANNVLIARQRQWGLEAEWVYRLGDWQWTLSHAYVNLVDFTLLEGEEVSLISNAPNGYGDNLNNWSQNITKAVLNYRIDPRWSAYGSTQYYWGFDGIRDWSDWYDTGRPPEAEHRVDSQTRLYGPNLYLNLGLRFQPSDSLTWVLTGHNLAGLADKNLNKRNYLGEASAYRLQAPALSLTLRVDF